MLCCDQRCSDLNLKNWEILNHLKMISNIQVKFSFLETYRITYISITSEEFVKLRDIMGPGSYVPIVRSLINIATGFI